MHLLITLIILLFGILFEGFCQNSTDGNKVVINLDLTTFKKFGNNLILEVLLYDGFYSSGYKNYFKETIQGPIQKFTLLPPEPMRGMLLIKRGDTTLSQSGTIILSNDTLFVRPGNYQGELWVTGGENIFMQENFILPFALPGLIENDRSFRRGMVHRFYQLSIPENRRLEMIYREYERNVIKTVRDNCNSFHILSKLVENRENISPQTLDTSLSLFSRNLQESTPARYLKAFITNSRWIQDSIAFNNYVVRNEGGESYNLGELIKRRPYSLVDFWASWCAPCKAFNKQLLGAINQFDSTYFQILSISIDEKEEDWKRAITDEKLPWISTIEPSFQGVKSPLATRLNINAIPQSYLLDSTGKVIMINPKLSDLTAYPKIIKGSD